MRESKRRQIRDRLSELPESLIFHIFWRLPMIDVVRTTILSKHWKNLWNTTPYLNFIFDEDRDSISIRNFINRALMLWEGSKIQKLNLELNVTNDNSYFTDLDLWLHFALRKGVEELCVFNPCPDRYVVPQCLYSYSPLKVLSLIDCSLQIKGNVQWNLLKSLNIRSSDVSASATNKVLCGSPQLEVLSTSGDSSYIRSSSLKRLICYSSRGKLTIWTPNLERLEISYNSYSKYSLMDVSSLTHVTVHFNDHHGSGDIPGEALRAIFPAIQHVENVTLSFDWCIKVLGDLIKKGLIPASSNAKFLKLNYHCEEYKPIFSVLEIFPKLEMLVLKIDNITFFGHVCKSLKFDANVPKSILRQLRTIEITWKDDNMWKKDHYSLFPFIEIILKYASKLRNMVIRVARAPKPKYLFLVSQKLLRMPRSSPNAELLFCELPCDILG